MQTITPLHFMLLLAYAAIIGASQPFFVNASKQIGSNFNVNGFFYAALYSYWLYISIFFYIIATGFWMYLLYRIDIRTAYPIASTSVIFAALFQNWRDGKSLPTSYWIGVLIVLIGLTLINSSSNSNN